MKTNTTATATDLVNNREHAESLAIANAHGYARAFFKGSTFSERLTHFEEILDGDLSFWLGKQEG